MAEKVMTISQDTYEIDGGEMYAKQLFGSLETPNYWNLYDIMAQLLSDGRLVNYGGILLAEYYKGYKSLQLKGAGAGGAYVVSDTDGNGNFIMYTEDITHVWDTNEDGKGNRWVAFCFANENSDFDITDTSISPRSIYIGRKVGNIRALVNGRCSDLVILDGSKLGRFISGSYTQNWGKLLVVKNIVNASGIIYGAGPEELYISADTITKGIYSNPHNIDISLCSLVVDCPYIRGELIASTHGAFSAYNWKTLIIRSEDASFNIDGYNSGQAKSLSTITLLDTEQMTIKYSFATASITAGITKLYIHYGTNNKEKSVTLGSDSPSTQNGWKQLSDVILQDGWNKPLNVSLAISLTEDTIYANILQRLKQDETDCGDGVTITLGRTNLAKLTSEESVQLLDDLTNIYGYTFA